MSQTEILSTLFQQPELLSQILIIGVLPVRFESKEILSSEYVKKVMQRWYLQNGLFNN